MRKKKDMIFIHSKKRSFFERFSLSDTLAETAFFSMVFYLTNHCKIKKDKNFRIKRQNYSVIFLRNNKNH
jgi:hypothetical protein